MESLGLDSSGSGCQYGLNARHASCSTKVTNTQDIACLRQRPPILACVKRRVLVCAWKESPLSFCEDDYAVSATPTLAPWTFPIVRRPTYSANIRDSNHPRHEEERLEDRASSRSVM